MPNWCNCTLTISGPRRKIEQVVRAATGRMVDTPDGRPLGMLEYMVPVVPADGEVTAQDQTREWGTKWDITDAEVLSEHSVGDDMLEVVMVFDTAWSPPRECFETWFAENPDCDCVLDYHEPGLAFVGRFSPQWGEDTYEYSAATADTVRKLVPEDLVDHWDLEEFMRETQSE